MAMNDAYRRLRQCKGTRKDGQPCPASTAAAPAARPASSPSAIVARLTDSESHGER